MFFEVCLNNMRNCCRSTGCCCCFDCCGACGGRGKRKYRGGVAVESRKEYEELADLVERGFLVPKIERVYQGLERIREAHVHIESGRKVGSVLVAVGAQIENTGLQKGEQTEEGNPENQS